MGLLYYEQKFSELRMNTGANGKSPHKVALLLAVIELFNNRAIQNNKIYFDNQLKQAFIDEFNKLATQSDRNNPHLPFYHLKSSGFWHHSIIPGKRDSYNDLTTASSANVIDQHIQYAYLDDELFELLQSDVVRKLLKQALLKNLSDDDRIGLLDVGKAWDWLECEYVVHLYFTMLEMQVKGEAFVKSHLYTQSAPKLHNRNNKSIEAKCQNVSAILVQYGYPYVTGLKPRWNYQQQLEKVVLAYLASHNIKLFDVFDQSLLMADVVVDVDWDLVQDNEIPEHIPSVKESKPEYLAKKADYSQRESDNRKLGESGEEFVLSFERHRMETAGRLDLVNEVKWSSKDEGDGLGYDIRSFDPVNDKELFIEVKTTNSGKYQPFYISDNEVSFSKDYADQYSLYRVYQFKSNPRFFSMPGEVSKYVNLRAKSYMAAFK